MRYTTLAHRYVTPGSNQQRRLLLLNIVLMFLAAAGFLLLAYVVFVLKNTSFDAAFSFLRGHDSTSLWTGYMNGLTFFGSSQFLLPAYSVLVLFHLFSARYRNASIIALTGIGAYLLSASLKTHFYRPRPLNGLITYPSTFSFPSGHATSALTFFLLLAFLVGRLETFRSYRSLCYLLAMLVALTIGLSRIYLGVHYPSDVLAGYCLSLFWLSAMRIVYQFWQRNPGIPRDSEVT